MYFTHCSNVKNLISFSYFGYFCCTVAESSQSALLQLLHSFLTLQSFWKGRNGILHKQMLFFLFWSYPQSYCSLYVVKSGVFSSVINFHFYQIFAQLHNEPSTTGTLDSEALCSNKATGNNPTGVNSHLLEPVRPAVNYPAADWDNLIKIKVILDIKGKKITDNAVLKVFAIPKVFC